MNNKRVKEDISDKFKKGLWEKYEMTIPDLNYWKYCGGDGGKNNRHLNYWKLNFGNVDTPLNEERCVCNHKIKENCYITDKENKELLILGNCCIKRFIKKSGRTCENCGKFHKNIKINKCNNCRGCLKCGGETSISYKYCSSCFNSLKCYM